MRIGILSMDYPPRMAGGTTIHTYQLAVGFAKLGHIPYVISACGRHGAAKFEAQNGIKIRRVRRPYTLFSAFAMRSILNEIEVVHGHGNCTYGFLRMYPNYPTVVKMHNTWLAEYHRYKSLLKFRGLMRLYVHMDRYCVRKAKAIIAISEVIKRETMEYGVAEDTIRVIHNGIDLKPFLMAKDLRDKLGIEREQIVIAYIGRLVPHKGVWALAEAYKRLATHYDDIVLLVVGDGSERPKLESALKNLVARVKFTGYVPYEQIPRYYATADIIVYPSLYEPLGNVVLESMAAGKPLVASNIGGIPEIFNEHCGILIKPPSTTHDVQNLVNAIDKLINSSSMRVKLGAGGRKHVQRFSWTNVCLQTIEVLESVLKS